MVSSVAAITCPTIEIDSITNSDGTAFDSVVFTLNKLAQTFTISTVDNAKAGLYNFKLNLKHTGSSYSRISSIPFSGEIVSGDPCFSVTLTHEGLQD